MVDPISEQYERYPYPLRSPDEDLARVNQLAPLDDIKVIAHYGFRGHLNPDRKYRFLVAGGGTGDSVIHLGYQARCLGLNAEIVYIDLSAASRGIAEHRAALLELDNITYHTGSLLDVAEMGLGQFDYINCCGVIHHLPDPAAGMAALAKVLAPGGLMGIMVYGEVGRTGLYHAQTMLRMMVGQEDLDTQIAFARGFLSNLPQTNWLLRNERLSYKEALCDAEVVDRFLHRRDRAYKVQDILDLCSDSGVEVVDFSPRLLYSPAVFTKDEQVLERVKSLSKFEQYALGELLGGVINKHGFFVRKTGDSLSGIAPIEPHIIPEFLGVKPKAVARLAGQGAIQLNIGGVSVNLGLPRTHGVLATLSYMDGRTSLDDIRKQVSLDLAKRLTWMEFKEIFSQIYIPFSGCGALILKQPLADQG